jgi:predicted nucleic acid-binding protein
MLVDAHILIFAYDPGSSFHQPAGRWLTDILESGRRVGVPSQPLTAFVRLVTNARVVPRPDAPATAADIVRAWLDVPTVWIPARSRRAGTCSAISSSGSPERQPGE